MSSGSRLRVTAVPIAMAAIVVLAFAGGLATRITDHDFLVFVSGGQRLLDGVPLYLYSRPHESWHMMNQDFQGPPFQGVFFVPWAYLAAADYEVAHGLWDLLNLTTLGAGLWCWMRALEPALPASGPLWRSPAALVALAAVAVPIYANVHSANTSGIVLALTGAAALAMSRGRHAAAGAAIGVATAFKAFPALFIAYLLWRREWRAATVSIATAAALTLLLLPALGWPAYLDTLRAWLAHTAPEAWPQWSQNQSVAMLVRRVVPPSMESIVLTGWTAAALAFLLAATRSTKAPDLALVAVVAVLLTPIAWNHYFVLLFPAAVYACAAPGPSQRARQGAILMAVVLLSVLSRLTLGEDGAEILRQLGHCTIAAIVVAAAAAHARPRVTAGHVAQRLPESPLAQ